MRFDSIGLSNNACVVSQEPFRCDIDHKLSKAMCLGSGLVECQVCLDKGAYVPGETIEITATVTNNSKVTIKSTRATLTEVSKSTYILHHPHIIESTAVLLCAQANDTLDNYLNTYLLGNN